MERLLHIHPALALSLVCLVFLFQISIAFCAVYFRMGHRAEHGLFSLLALSLAVALTGTIVEFTTPYQRHDVLFWLRVDIIGMTTAVPILIHLVATLLNTAIQQIWRLRFFYFLGLVFIYLTLATSSITRLAPSSTPLPKVSDATFGTMAPAYDISLAAGVLYACILLFGGVKQSRMRERDDGSSAQEFFPFAPYLKRLLVCLIIYLGLRIYEFYDLFSPETPDAWDLIPPSLAAMAFCGVMGWCMVSEIVRQRALLSRSTFLAEARLGFTRDAQHEIKNGLDTIRKILENTRERVRRGVFAETIEPRLTISIEEVDNLSETLGAMLDMARIEAGVALNLGQRRAVNIPMLIERICRKHLDMDSWDSPKEKEMRFKERVSMSENLPDVSCMVFERPLQQALSNLIHNAFKYSPIGGRIEINIKATHESGLHITIRDFGIGIEPDALDAIFERPFYRAGAEFSSVSGNGIGLNLTRRYIQAHGGRVWANSAGTGSGSEFHVYIPYETENRDDKY